MRRVIPATILILFCLTASGQPAKEPPKVAEKTSVSDAELGEFTEGQRRAIRVLSKRCTDKQLVALAAHVATYGDEIGSTTRPTDTRPDELKQARDLSTALNRRLKAVDGERLQAQERIVILTDELLRLMDELSDARKGK